MQIEYLAHHPDLIPTLARWAQATWGHWSPQRTKEAYTAMYTARTQIGRLPETFVAMDGERPVGMASLVDTDLPARPDLGPWLAAVYVDEVYRRRGIGSRLVTTVLNEARALGIRHLYLFTPDRADFYSTLGWRFLAEATHRGDPVVIMVYDL